MFLKVQGAEPTNYPSERAVRHGVISWKLSFDTQQAAFSRCAETMVTAIETCRQQARKSAPTLLPGA